MAWLLSRISSLRIDGDVLTAGESVSKRSAARACASWPADGPWVLQMNRDDNGPKSSRDDLEIDIQVDFAQAVIAGVRFYQTKTDT